jgi:hypothetical protein
MLKGSLFSFTTNIPIKGEFWRQDPDSWALQVFTGMTTVSLKFYDQADPEYPNLECFGFCDTLELESREENDQKFWSWLMDTEGPTVEDLTRLHLGTRRLNRKQMLRWGAWKDLARTFPNVLVLKYVTVEEMTDDEIWLLTKIIQDAWPANVTRPYGVEVELKEHEEELERQGDEPVDEESAEESDNKTDKETTEESDDRIDKEPEAETENGKVHLVVLVILLVVAFSVFFAGF